MGDSNCYFIRDYMIKRLGLTDGPTIYRSFTGKIIDGLLGEVEYFGVERDWSVMGETPEQNRALGRCFELTSKDGEVVAWSDSRQKAVENLHNILLAHSIRGS